VFETETRMPVDTDQITDAKNMWQKDFDIQGKIVDLNKLDDCNSIATFKDFSGIQYQMRVNT